MGKIINVMDFSFKLKKNINGEHGSMGNEVNVDGQ